MKYLITGAPGWLGNRFVEAVRQENNGEVRCLVLPAFEKSFRQSYPDADAVPGDMTDRQSLEPFFKNSEGGVLFHLAGLVHATRGTKQFFDVNVRGTENLLEAARRANIKRIIVISSNSPAGCNPHKDHLFTEDMPYHPYMAYGRSKMQMELKIKEVQQTGGIETVILRPCWFYGPGQPPRQTLFFTMIKDGKAPIVGSGENKRSMSYVDNVCQALLLAAKSPKANGQTYWITDKQAYTMNQIVDTVERLLEKEFNIKVAHKRWRLPAITSEIALAVDAGLQSVGVYHQKIHVLSEMNKTIAASIEKAERELGYKPEIDLEEGMRRSIRWCLDHRHVI
jgi:nucleoside-diphosphate-sugar epimerase